MNKVLGIDLVGKFSEWKDNCTLETIYHTSKQLKEFYNSFYTDDALFELAMTLSFETKYDESITYYDKILNDFQKSPYFLKS